jgi:hypothetical protein
LNNGSVEPNRNAPERMWAAAAHFSGIPFPILGPLVVFAFGMKSRFVRFHSVHALVGTIVMNFFLFLLGGISIVISVYGIYRNWQEGFQNFSWWTVILKSAATWVIFALIGLANTVLNISQGIVAYRGEVPAGFTTRLLHRLLERHSSTSPVGSA